MPNCRIVPGKAGIELVGDGVGVGLGVGVGVGLGAVVPVVPPPTVVPVPGVPVPGSGVHAAAPIAHKTAKAATRPRNVMVEISAESYGALTSE
jgi:hypothetical protein